MLIKILNKTQLFVKQTCFDKQCLLQQIVLIQVKLISKAGTNLCDVS